MEKVVMILQNIAVLLLFVEAVIAARQRPSRFQLRMFLLIISTLIMLVGYTVELIAVSEEMALFAAGFSYIGKPIALLCSALCVAEYCNRKVSFGYILSGSFLSIAIPMMIILRVGGERCTWYYQQIAFSENQQFSNLKIEARGPAYWLYAAYLIVTFLYVFVILAKEYPRSKTAVSKKQVIYLASSIGCSLVGYLIYLSGLSGGYDATMLGAVIGVFIMFALVVRFPFFDSVTLAKEKALEDASSAILVFDGDDRLSYKNKLGEELLANGVISEKRLMAMPLGRSDMTFNEYVYEVMKNDVDRGHYHFGKTFELTDVTAKVTYSSRLEREVAERTERIRDLQRTMIATLADIIEARDTMTGEHVKRVCIDVYEIGKALRNAGEYTDILTDEYLNMLRDVAPLHDIGKISISDAILCKPGKLTPEEFEVIKTHPVKGAAIIETSMTGIESPEYIAMAKDVALYHHEKWNGKGYPNGLRETEIPLCARIMAVADVYDAVRYKRCYRDAMTRDEARLLIEEERGNFFDPKVVDAFLKVQDKLEKLIKKTPRLTKESPKEE